MCGGLIQAPLVGGSLDEGYLVYYYNPNLPTTACVSTITYYSLSQSEARRQLAAIG